jgi:sugar phosphate permease
VRADESNLEAAPATNPASAGRVRWKVVFCAFIVAAVSYLDRNNISIAASSVQKELV